MDQKEALKSALKLNNSDIETYIKNCSKEEFAKIAAQIGDKKISRKKAIAWIQTTAMFVRIAA